MKITKTKGKGILWIYLLVMGFSLMSSELNIVAVQETSIVGSPIYTPDLEEHVEIVIFEDTDFNETHGFPTLLQQYDDFAGTANRCYSVLEFVFMITPEFLVAFLQVQGPM